MLMGCRFCGCQALGGFFKSYHELFKTEEDVRTVDWRTRVGDLSFIVVCKKCLKKYPLDKILAVDSEDALYPLPRELTKGELVMLVRAKAKADRRFDSSAWIRSHGYYEEDFFTKSLLRRLMTFDWS